MRGPARAAGLGELQIFLETGFDTFRAMNGAQEFLAIVKRREEELAAALFAADPQGRRRRRRAAPRPGGAARAA